jgi:hypothetical protein
MQRQRSKNTAEVIKDVEVVDLDRLARPSLKPHRRNSATASGKACDADAADLKSTTARIRQLPSTWELQQP